MQQGFELGSWWSGEKMFVCGVPPVASIDLQVSFLSLFSGCEIDGLTFV